MHPELFRIGDFAISTFGLLLAASFLVGAWITSIRMAEEGLDPEKAYTILIYVMAGGILGSKIYYAVDVSLREDVPIARLLFARDGITWYGGLIAATVVGGIGCRIHRISVKTFMDCVAVAAAVGQSVGRLGCFMVGDDYGRATDAPWGIAFPRGAPPTETPVHPTQLYEIAWLLPVAGFLWSRRKKSPFLFGEYVALNGFGRLVIEHWRVNPEVALGLTEPQWIGAGLMIIGISSWFWLARKSRAAIAA